MDRISRAPHHTGQAHSFHAVLDDQVDRAKIVFFVIEQANAFTLSGSAYRQLVPFKKRAIVGVQWLTQFKLDPIGNIDDIVDWLMAQG